MTGVAILGDSPVLIFPLNERKIKKKTEDFGLETFDLES